MAARVENQMLTELRRRVEEVESGRGRRTRAGDSLVGVLRVPGPLGAALPAGGLVRGQVTACSRGSVLAGLLAAVTAVGHAAVIGRPTIGLLAAHEMGADLSRLAIVAPGQDPLTVAGILATGLDLVVIDLDGLRVTPSQVRPLLGKAHQHGCALIISGRGVRGFPIDLDLDVRPVRYLGIGLGHGRVQGVHLEIGARQRGRPAQKSCVAVLGTGTGTVDWRTVDNDTATDFRRRLESA